MENILTARDEKHTALAVVWARWNGQRGTPIQVAKIKRQLGVADLIRMLSERGYVIPDGWAA